MKTIDPGNNFASWRDAARRMLNEGIAPEEISWEVEPGLFDGVDSPPSLVGKAIKVPADFVALAREVACHADASRWALLYRVLWRLTRGGERHLLEIASDIDVAKARTLAKNVRREIHKAHAFVRFKLISTDEATGRERYAAWFEPDHQIVEAATPFFRDRFANMDWSIFTPKGCAHWIGGELAFTPGIRENPLADPDALEAAWSTYYRSIFNPARLKVKMMQTEMPKRYWKNLPEAAQIKDLIAGSAPRLDGMLDREARPARPPIRHAYLDHLRSLSSAKPTLAPPPPDVPLAELKRLSANCRACPLWENATCTVFGEGPETAKIMIVGEQPGDREDIAGRAFVGPAGKLLDRALADAGIDRQAAYLTNAVKHFKWKPSGKIRLHQKPDSAEIDACRPWLLGELKNIAPQVLILLGATAARSLLGSAVAVTRDRGLIHAPHLASKVILTTHPSYLLRLPDPARKEEEYQRFVADLKLT